MYIIAPTGELYCKDCYNQRHDEGQHVDTALLNYQYDAEYNLLGFECPNCKQSWSISQFGRSLCQFPSLGDHYGLGDHYE